MEDTKEISPKITRRAAIKAALGGATAAGLAVIGRKEIQAAHEGIQTPVGIFYPLYERHDFGIEEKDLPPRLDAFFKEGFLGRKESLFAVNPNSLLYFFLVSNEKSPKFQKDILEKLARDQTKILFGDITIHNFKDELKESYVKRLLTGYAVTTSGILHEYITNTLDKQSRAEPNQKTLTRRSFIKKAAGAAGLAISAPALANIPAAGLALAGMNVERENVAQRIYWRLSGLIHHSAPEVHLLFLRNIIWADKLLTTGEKLSGASSKKARIAFNVGASHTGVEDFLRAGHDFTRWLISQYPTEVLKKIIDLNGGVDDFCSIRVLTLPDQLSIPLKEKEDVNQVLPNLPLKEERITDELLAKTLKDKLSS